jgi:hypothetical protein
MSAGVRGQNSASLNDGKNDRFSHSRFASSTNSGVFLA